MTRSDLDFFLEVRNECADYLHDNRRFTQEECHRWWGSSARKGEYYLIQLNDWTPIGYFRIDRDERNKSVLIGADIHKDYRGRGYAYKSYNEFMQYFYEKGYGRIWLEVLHNNIPAISLYLKLGFRTEGIKINAVKRDDKYIHSVIMAKLNVRPNTPFSDFNHCLQAV